MKKRRMIRSLFKHVAAPLGVLIGTCDVAFAHPPTGAAAKQDTQSFEELLIKFENVIQNARKKYPTAEQIADRDYDGKNDLQNANDKENFQIAANFLTEDQVRQRRVRAEARRLQGLYPYFSKRNQAEYFYKNCVQMDYKEDQVPQGMRGFWREMQDMKTSVSTIEKEIAQQMQDMDLFVCKANLKSISAAGVWFNSSEGVLWVDKDHDLKGVRSTIAHEAIHAIQDERSQGYLIRPSDAFVEKLAVEGSAVVFEGLIELERMQNDPNYISDHKDTKVMRQISKSYKKARDAGASHKDALQLAGKEGFLAQILNEYWFGYYRNSHLSNELITLENHGNMKSYDDVDLMALVKSSGQLTPQFNIFSNFSNVSEIKARFADDVKLNQAFERIELEEIKISKGVEDWEYQAVEFLLDANENPYLDVDLNDVKLPGDILAQMDDLQRVSRSSKDKTHTLLMGKAQP